MKLLSGILIGVVVAYTGSIIIAQEVDVLPEEITPVIEKSKYDDGNPDVVSYVEALEKSATSTPEMDIKYTNDQIIQKLNIIEQKLDVIIKRR